MEILTISLTKAQKAFVDAQVAAEGFRSASEYLAQLLDQAEVQKERDRINALLREGLRSEASPMTPQDWEEIRREARDLDRLLGTGS